MTTGLYALDISGNNGDTIPPARFAGYAVVLIKLYPRDSGLHGGTWSKRCYQAAVTAGVPVIGFYGSDSTPKWATGGTAAAKDAMSFCLGDPGDAVMKQYPFAWDLWEFNGNDWTDAHAQIDATRASGFKCGSYASDGNFSNGNEEWRWIAKYGSMGSHGCYLQGTAPTSHTDWLIWQDRPWLHTECDGLADHDVVDPSKSVSDLLTAMTVSGGGGGNGGGPGTTSMDLRARIESTAFVASRVGVFDLMARVKPMTVPSFHTLQVRWGPSGANPCPYTLPETPRDFSKASATGWIDVPVGRIYVGGIGGTILHGPTQSSTITYELWSRRDSGTGKLRFERFFLMPAADDSYQALVSLGARASAPESWLGSQLLLGSAISSHSGSAGVDGYVTQAGLMNLNAVNEATATPPAGGSSYGAGHQTFSVVLNTYRATLDGAKIGEFRVRDITASSDIKVIGIDGSKVANWSGMYPISFDFDGTAGHYYQGQVFHTASSSDVIDVANMGHFISSNAAAGEFFRCDPTRYLSEHLDANGATIELLRTEGKTPMVLDPGTNVLVAVGAEATIPGFPAGESVLTRLPVVDLTYATFDYE